MHRIGRKCGERRGRERATRTGPHESQPSLPRQPHLGSRTHPTLTLTCRVPRQFVPSLASNFAATYGPTDLQTRRQTGDRGRGVLGGLSSTRDKSALIVDLFFPRCLSNRHSLPSPPHRKSDSSLIKWARGLGRVELVFIKGVRKGYSPNRPEPGSVALLALSHSHLSPSRAHTSTDLHSPRLVSSFLQKPAA